MDTADALDDGGLPGWSREYARWFTTGSWATEAESASDLDRRLTTAGMFVVHREVAGTLTQPRVGQRDRALRIDRILTPGPELRERGWTHGAVGIEIKRSRVNIGPPLAQAMDYVRGSWNVRGIWIQLAAVFLWPCEKQSGPLASLMVHNRIGSASGTGYAGVKLCFGEEVIYSDDTQGVRLGRIDSGHMVGSR
jgi:hypothetical protein